MIEILNPDNALSGVNLALLLAFVALLAVSFICFSGFVKYSIIFNIIKNAVGTQQIPPTIVVNLLSALMAINHLWPYIEPGIERVKPLFVAGVPVDEILEDQLAIKSEISVFDLLKEHEIYFPELFNYADQKSQQISEFLDGKITITNDKVRVYLGSLLYDLYKGFEIGIKFYIVFVAIDFLVAVILSGVGMMMLSPTVISTPIKIAIFYFSESWTILLNI